MKYIYILPLLLLLSSCALKRDYVTIQYRPDTQPVEFAQVNNIKVSVSVIDTRQNKSAIGCKKNAYGNEMAYIMAENDVSQVFEGAIISELQKRGFVIAQGETAVHIEFCKFENDFKLGFWSSEARSESVSTVMVRSKNGTIKYSKTIFGYGNQQNCLLHSGKNACLSLEDALKDTVQKLMNDPLFIDSLIRA